MNIFSKTCAVFMVIFLSACSQVKAPEAPVSELTDDMVYDQNSWQTMIPESCTSFFDGCNTCNRAEGAEMAACTRKFCQVYEEPKCLDGEES